MRTYLDLCKHILTHGKVREDRTGTGIVGVFGYQMRYDLAEGFPLLTTKDMSGARLDGIIHELLWFLKGDTNIGTLLDNGVNIWNADAYRAYKIEQTRLNKQVVSYEDFIGFIQTSSHFRRMHGSLGPIYGEQWRSWSDGYNQISIDQIADVVASIKNDPYSRRHIVSAWNVAELEDMALPPCHVLFQFYVSGDGKLSCQLYQRSGDVFLGVPYNIASYSLLTLMMAKQTGLEPGEFIHTLGDAHIYLNHIDQVKLQLTREPKSLPNMLIASDVPDIFSYKREDFTPFGYQSHPAIKGEVSVGD